MLRHMSDNCSKIRTHCEWEVEGLRGAEVSWLQRVDIPRDQRVDDNIDDEHDQCVSHRKLVVDVCRSVDGTPLHSNTFETIS